MVRKEDKISEKTATTGVTATLTVTTTALTDCITTTPITMSNPSASSYTTSIKPPEPLVLSSDPSQDWQSWIQRYQWAAGLKVNSCTSCNIYGINWLRGNKNL